MPKMVLNNVEPQKTCRCHPWAQPTSRTFRILFIASVMFGTFTYIGLYTIRYQSADSLYSRHSDNHETYTTNTPPPTYHHINSTTNSTPILCPINRGSYIRVGDLDVAIATAVYYENVPEKNGFNVFLNGWGKHGSDMNFKCCFLNDLNSTELLEVKAATYHVYSQWVVDMQNAEFSCSISSKQHASLPARDRYFKFVAFSEKSCKNASNKVVRIEQRKQIPNSVGICLKVSYGKVDPELIVEWFEYNKALGVTKVFSFLADDLEPESRKVFLYYNSTGFLDADPIDPAPSRNGTRRGFKRPRWESQAYVDEVMAINDCKHRMAGLDFVIIMDIDEWIVPKLPEDNIYTILKKTLQKYPKAGSFRFDSHVVMLDWNQTRTSPLQVMQYVNRTSFPNYDGSGMNTRWAFISDRIVFAQNNRAWPKREYSSVNVPNDLYTLLHRRMCKIDNWKDCKSQKIRVRDETITRNENQLIENMQKLPLSSILTGSKEYIDRIMKWSVLKKHTTVQPNVTKKS